MLFSCSSAGFVCKGQLQHEVRLVTFRRLVTLVSRFGQVVAVSERFYQGRRLSWHKIAALSGVAPCAPTHPPPAQTAGSRHCAAQRTQAYNQ